MFKWLEDILNQWASSLKSLFGIDQPSMSFPTTSALLQNSTNIAKQEESKGYYSWQDKSWSQLLGNIKSYVWLNREDNQVNAYNEWLKTSPQRAAYLGNNPGVYNRDQLAWIFWVKSQSTLKDTLWINDATTTPAIITKPVEQVKPIEQISPAVKQEPIIKKPVNRIFPQDKKEESKVKATIFAEALGETPEGRQAVFNTMINRANQRWINLFEVVAQPYQYTAVDSTNKLFIRARDYFRWQNVKMSPKEKQIASEIENLYNMAMEWKLTDLTNWGIYYINPVTATDNKYYNMRDKNKDIKIWQHVFYTIPR